MYSEILIKEKVEEETESNNLLFPSSPINPCSGTSKRMAQAVAKTMEVEFQLLVNALVCTFDKKITWQTLQLGCMRSMQ